MCDLEPEFLIAEFKKEAAKFKPADVLRWNGMSWDYLSIALTLPEASISKADRTALVRFAMKAVASAACLQLGFRAIPRLFKWRRIDRIHSLIEAMASYKTPPEPGPTGSMEVDFGSGLTTVETVPEDEHRVQRRRAITAMILLKIKDEADWRPTRAEFEEIAVKAGARIRQSA